MSLHLEPGLSWLSEDKQQSTTRLKKMLHSLDPFHTEDSHSEQGRTLPRFHVLSLQNTSPGEVQVNAS